MSAPRTVADRTTPVEAGPPDAPAERPTIVIQPTRGLRSLELGEIWRYRELLWFIGWRDLKVRYKQTALGAVWAILQPLLMMLVFVAFVGRYLPSPKGVPYAVFAFAGLIPWTLFAQSLSGSSQSLVMSANLVSKVYFPRLILPVAAAGSFIVDFMLAFVMLIVMMVIYSVHPTSAIVWLPVFTLLAVITAISVGVWLSALNVRYRDFVHAVPFIIQLWLFASPVAYSSDVVSGTAATIYGLNPMAGVIEGFRWALIGTPPPPAGLMAASVTATIALLVGGIIYFQRTQRTFADVI